MGIHKRHWEKGALNGEDEWSRKSGLDEGRNITSAESLFRPARANSLWQRSAHQALSELLQKMPYHAEAAKVPSFRNPDGVAFKLQNIRQVATGKGLGNTSRTDRAVWDEFGSKPDEVRRLALAINDGMQILAATPPITDDMDEFPEGQVLTELHKRRERDKSLRKKLLARRATAGLSCDICGLRRPDLAPSLQSALFEAHHVVPLGSTLERVSRLADLALLCACCHRLVHGLISTEKRWFSIAEARERLSPPLSPSTC